VKSGDIVKDSRKRKSIRLNRELYQEKDQPFSITVCTHKNVPLVNEFGELIFQSIMEGTLRKASDLMAVCIMPNHVHFLLAPISENLLDLIGKWKGYTTHLIWREGYKGKVWQRSFYDHALRQEEDIIKVAEYIVFNPVRKEMVQNWKDYPYSWHRWIHDGRPRRAATTDCNS
jgi:REP element-mobilizing transposase RayT